ncbi:hypothetical protein BG015_009477 [Linnemannia schmuckeri]|uniref:Uncharacterized protein n=1 Tax=Linnemannia schmuckeri TaxID=64567 RepID=A0A9P5V9K6_9FUNG|nr:hypothetical protein BG015_009477 [Linnemannia schmuckeri]
MCSTHYNELYPELRRQPVFEAIQENNGDFNERKGTAKVKIATAARAADFYWALSSSPFFQRMYILLDWVATTADLKELVFAIQQSDLQQADLGIQTANSATLYTQPTPRRQTQTIQQKLATGGFLRVQLRNREGLAVSSFIEQSKTLEHLSLEMKDGFYVIVSYKSGSTTPSYINAMISKLNSITYRLPLEYITDLTLTGSHTLSEVDVLVPMLIACCTSLKRLSVTLVSTLEYESRPIPINSDGNLSENSQPIVLSVFELGSIPTLTSVVLVHSVCQRTSFDFPMTKLNLKNFEIYELSGLDKILRMHPLVTSLTLTVSNLDDAYGLVVPFVQHLDRDMTLRMEQKSGGNLILQFKRNASDSGSGSSVSNIQLRIGGIAHFRKLPLDQVKTLYLLSLTHIFEQHDQILEIIRRCTSMETLEVCYGKALSLATFCVGRLLTFKTLRLTRSGGDGKSLTQFVLPIKKFDLGKQIISVFRKPSDLEAFFKANRELVNLSLTVDFFDEDVPVFLSTIKSLQGQHSLLTFTLTDEKGSCALIAFADDNTITSYSLRLKKLDKQEDLQGYDLSSITEFILAGHSLTTKQIDKLLQELLSNCPHLESIDIHCGSSYLKSFFYLSCNLTTFKKCFLRNGKGQVAPSLNLLETYLNLGNELLPTTMYPNLIKTLQARPTVIGLKVLVESTLEAYEFFVNVLAVKLPWLEEVKIIQQNVGPKMVVSFAGGDIDGGGVGEGGPRTVSSIFLDVRSSAQLQPSMYSLLTKLTFSGQLNNWTPQALSQIPLSSCENLSTLELKCIPSQFPRILRSIHEASLMHPSLRQLKLWDGTRDNILTGTHIDDPDAILIRLQQVRMIDFQNYPAELEALLQDYPSEIAHLELDSSFYGRQAEIVEESLKLGKVHIRHIQWDISSTKDVGLFETMLWAVSHYYNYVTSDSNSENKYGSRVVPTVAFRVATLSVPQSALTLFDTTSTSSTTNNNQQQRPRERPLSTLGQFMTRFATHLILVNSGLELFLPDLFATELHALQELEIQVNRWLKSLFQRGGDGGQFSASKKVESKLVAIKAATAESNTVAAVDSKPLAVDVYEGSISDDYDSGFVFDDPMSSSITVDNKPSSATTSAPILVLSLKSPNPGVLIHTATPPTVPTPPSICQPLWRLTLHNLPFSPQQWKSLLEFIDYLSLRSLNLERTGFGDRELILLTRLYTDQITRARKARKENRETLEVEAGGEVKAQEEAKGLVEEEEEFVVRLYTTSVTQAAVDREHDCLTKNGCSQLKIVLV